MKSTSLVPTCAALALSIAILPALAQADPIPITGGFLTAVGQGNFGTFEITGPGLSLTGSTQTGNVEPAACSGCQSGTVLRMGSLFTDRHEFADPIIIDGSPFTGALSGVFEFTSASIITPDEPADFTIQQAFTFSGLLSAFDELGQNFLFSRMLVGQGLLTANFDLNPQSEVENRAIFDFRDIRYEFTAAEPVPEPLTLLLVGSGLGTIAFRNRRRRRQT
jgi:hypothetical protein